MSDVDLRNKVALVTGASAGIGSAIASKLAEAGCRVVLTARRLERLNTLQETLTTAYGASVMTVAGDLRQESDIAHIFKTIRDTWGGVDILVNNAGLGRIAPLMTGNTELWREMFEVNVLALAICSREAILDMGKRQDDGHIIHISSMSGHRVPTGSGGMYSATKHAVRALTEALRRELRAADSPIRITAISPGFVETEFAEVMLGDPEAAGRVYDRFPCLQPVDIAETVMHVLTQPQHVQIHDVLMRPTLQDS